VCDECCSSSESSRCVWVGESIAISAEFENYSSRTVIPYATLHQTQMFFANGKTRIRDTKFTVLTGECCVFSVSFYSPVHTGDQVEFNTVDFVESQQSRPCRFGPYTLATKSKGHSTFGRQSRLCRRHSQPSRRNCRPLQAVIFKLLPISHQNWR